MKFFIDTANLDQIKEAQDMGILDGVTTNPSLMAKEGITGEKNIIDHYLKICDIVDGDVSAEVISVDYDGIIKEGEALASLHKQIVIKVPMIEEGVKAIQFDNVTTVQIIYNLFRQRPNDYFFDMTHKKNVGIIVRVPLASGLLSGKMTRETTFNPNDHRHGNRNGEWFR